MLKERGLHLGARDRDTDEMIKGEKEIDSYTRGTLDPTSMKLYMDEDFTIACSDDVDIREIVRDSLTQANMLLIPAGSVANWMPIVNQFRDLINEARIPIVMIANAFVHKSEPPLLDQISSVVAQLGNVVVIAPKENPGEVPSYERHYKAAYTNEQKMPVDFEEVEAHLPKGARIIRALEYRLYREKEGGLKYDETDISLILTFLNELIQLKEKPDIVNILERHGLQSDEAQIKYLESFSTALSLFQPEDEINVK